MRNRAEELAKTSKTLILSEPFWGLFLMGLNKVWKKDFPTMGVSRNTINYQLTLGEGFWDILTPDWRVGILTHELIHIAFFHVEMSLGGKYPNKEVFAIAIDLVTNQYIRDTWLPAKNLTKQQFDAKYDPLIKDLKEKYLSGQITGEEYTSKIAVVPPRGVYIEDFADLKLELKRGVDYYYEKLLKESQSKKSSPGHNYLKELIQGMKQGIPGSGGHDWSDFEDLDEATQRLIKSQVEYQLKAASEQTIKSRGTIPGEVAQYLDKLENQEPPKFDWRGYLRRFAGGSVKTYTKKLRRKFNKRFEDNPGLRIKPKKHILVTVDTSGSVNNDELTEFFKEIDHIYRVGANITVLQYDAAISNISSYKRNQEIKIHGRGGTDFQPFIDHYNEHRRKYTSCIAFTDGEAPSPTKPIGRILWVLSTKSSENKNLPGPTIKLN